MKLTINMYGLGNEFTIGTVSKETWDYIQKKFNGDEQVYMDALDIDEVPPEHMIAPMSCEMYECDDLWHSSGCWLLSSNLEVLDENEDTVFSYRKFYEDSGIQMDYETHVIDDGIPYLAVWESVSKGLFLTGQIDVDEKFDPTKLTIHVKRVLFNHNEEYNEIAVGLSYDGKKIETEMGDSEGKGDTLKFIEVEQVKEDEE